jgi:uncharacterized repeat protein (TIGR01451 family)
LLLAVLVAAAIVGSISATGGSADAAPGDPALTISDHEGLQSPEGTWTNGNVTTYSVGDVIAFRFVVDGSAGASGTVDLLFSGPGGAGCSGQFFDEYFSLGSVVPEAGDPAPTVVAGPPIQSGTDWRVTFSFDFSPGAAEAVVGYSLRVSDDVSGCNGSSTGTEFKPQSATGDAKVVGAQRVPVPANKILVPPTVELTKTAESNVIDEPGGTVEFTLTVENTSKQTVTVVDLVDDHPLSAECLALVGEEIQPGSTLQCSYQVDLTEIGEHENTAAVTVSDADGLEGQGSDIFTVTVEDVLPTVALDKTVDPVSIPEPGGVFTYTLTVTNTSPESVVVVSISDSQSGAADDFSECQDLIGVEIASGGSASCSYSIERSEVGEYSNTASVTVADDEQNEAVAGSGVDAVVTEAPPLADLAIDKSLQGALVAGQQGIYQLEVRNLGPDPATQVVVSDQLPGLLEAVSVDADAGGSCTVEDGLVECGFPALAVDAVAVVEVVVSVGPEAQNSLVVNTAVVAGAVGDPDESNNSSTVEELVPEVLPQVVTPTPAPTATPTATPTPTPGSGTLSDTLAATGAGSGRLALWALSMIGLGVLLVMEDRRLRRSARSRPRHGRPRHARRRPKRAAGRARRARHAR